MVHFQDGFTDRDAIFANSKIIFVFYLNATFFIAVNKWDDPIFTAVKIVRHGIMCRIQNPFFNCKIRKKRFHPEISFEKTVGIMFGSRIQKWENMKITFRIGTNNHVQIISMVKAIPGGIPANITVGLREIPITAAVSDSFVSTITNTVFSFSCGSCNRCSIVGNGKGVRMDKAFVNGQA